jgi:hypothetical protein
MPQYIPVDATSCFNISASAGAGFKQAVCPLPAHLCFLGLSLAAFSRRMGPNTKRRYKKHAPL